MNSQLAISRDTLGYIYVLCVRVHRYEYACADGLANALFVLFLEVWRLLLTIDDYHVKHCYSNLLVLNLKHKE